MPYVRGRNRTKELSAGVVCSRRIRESMTGMNSWRLNRRSCFAVAVLCFPWIAQSSAQQPSAGRVSGHVVDSTGAAIAQASVFVRKSMPSEDNVRLLTHTDDRGDFTLVLPEGGYDVLVTSGGFAANVETVPVFARKTRQFEWRLKPLSCAFPGMNCDAFP